MAEASTIRKALVRETSKLISRHNARSAARSQEHKRYQKRSGIAASYPSNSKPEHWSAIREFDPYYVRSRLEKLYAAIAPKVRAGSYEFRPTLCLELSKEGGGVREISLSTVADSAIAYWLGKRLIRRNSFIFSSYAYAYRDDRSAHHAILNLSSELRRSPRIYSVEFDFANYFGSINHNYLLDILDNEFQVSPQERSLVVGIIKRPRAKTLAAYLSGEFEDTSVGIPQGSMLSLFLANAAALELDRRIERTGVVFARYADDTVVLADSYDKAHECATAFLSYGNRAGTQVNTSKSPGISLISALGQNEVLAKQSIDFLGHTLSCGDIRMSERTIRRIKSKVSRAIYDNLLLQPKRGNFNKKRIGAKYFDWDLLTLVNELRRYIYGRLSEGEVRSVLDNRGRPNLSRNVMSFYPFISIDQTKALDGWLVDTVLRAYKYRRALLSDSFGIKKASITREQLISGTWYSYKKVAADGRIPSFTRSLKYAKRVAKIYDLKQLPSPGYLYGGI